MEHRPLGRTGVQVSKLCLGAMMFGAWGNTDHDDCIRIIHRALDAGINFVDTADIYSQGESDVGIEETLGALTDLVRQGKVRYISSSVFPPSAIVEAQWAARERGLQRYVCEQPPVLGGWVSPALQPAARRRLSTRRSG
jgi:aryl-alcohol dehydrogenase-like predicted oxidoreductase